MEPVSPASGSQKTRERTFRGREGARWAELVSSTESLPHRKGAGGVEGRGAGPDALPPRARVTDEALRGGFPVCTGPSCGRSREAPGLVHRRNGHRTQARLPEVLRCDCAGVFVVLFCLSL
uniref:Uncharacterized protein n=1 Tax=Molossus molossus TaxID=27622 RepID=A0A7J8BYM7_MOLMO|nr:hypothetical protein HJG59_010097 [Molossus molossus]